MVDKSLFLETLREVAEIAKTSQQPLGKEEIEKYFARMELSEEQKEMVYQYLQLPEEMRTADPQTVEAEETEPGASKEEHSDEIKEESSVEKLSDSAYYRMYLKEVKEQEVLADADRIRLYEKLLAGDAGVTEQIVNSWLLRVLDMAKFYKTGPVNMEDVIQEGNMGLWVALSQVPAQVNKETMDAYLAGAVREAMENYIREVTGDSDWLQTVLGKAALLHEAQELLAKESGQTPSLRQLSAYTHIAEEEIKDILALYKEES